MHDPLTKYISQKYEAAPLAVFRIFFGLMMLASIVRFWSKGWIEKLYLEPEFHFSYYGFEWVKPLGVYTYALFALCGLSAILVTLGLKYRLAILTFFLSFTYIELMDKTTYLNHYYFVSVLSFILIFLPAHAHFSFDAWRGRDKQFVPRWAVDSIKVLLTIVYLYAGLAKLNSDWMLDAMPLKIWLPSKFDIPFLGSLMGETWVHYAFSWGGALYDLSIPFLLWYRPTRKVAFLFVVIFHVLTRVLFPIGMFPYIMIVSALIFFDPSWHKKVIQWMSKLIRYPRAQLVNNRIWPENSSWKAKASLGVITFALLIQLLMPWRYLAYPGELFWTEEGFRFSWRVMLMEKSGYAQFKVEDGQTGRWFYVDNTDFLTPMQEKQMSFQPDFILQYAHFLRDHFESQGHQDVKIFVESYVSLNGRLGKPLVDPTVDLAQEKESFKPKKWILPFDDEIKGI
ncbi:HTTM domain-containing protein [Croceiramulus getboli]|nr:HTTM domain-containing protein [Flavobacteriaceae bacterium YJPT1-3]